MQEFSEKLLAWFDQNQRSLPFRSDPTPYHVWVSEIMLQQTRVAAVLAVASVWYFAAYCNTGGRLLIFRTPDSIAQGGDAGCANPKHCARWFIC